MGRAQRPDLIQPARPAPAARPARGPLARGRGRTARRRRTLGRACPGQARSRLRL
jgi:hypothetical protein